MVRGARAAGLELAQRSPCAQLPPPRAQPGPGLMRARGKRGNCPAAAGSDGLHGEQLLLERREIPFFPLEWLGAAQLGWDCTKWLFKVLPTRSIWDSSRDELSLLPAAAPGLPCSLTAPQHQCFPEGLRSIPQLHESFVL